MSLSNLITGSCGFVDSSLAIGLKERSPAYHIIHFDNLKRRASALNLPSLAAYRIEFIRESIRNKEDLVSNQSMTQLTISSIPISI